MDFRNKGISNKSYQTWSDTIEKEKEARLKWNMRFKTMKEKFSDQTDIGYDKMYESIEFEDFIQKQKFKVPEIKVIPKDANYDSEVNEYLVKLGVKDKKTNIIKPIEMYEQSADEKSLIYNGISRDHEGRYKYLTERKKHKPEVKYPFPITSSMDYGWNMYDKSERLSHQNYKSTNFEFPSKYGLKNEIKDTFFRENGVLSDQWKDDIIKVRTG